MTNKSRTFGALLVIALALLALGVAAPAEAKKPKITATVDGKVYKFKGRYVLTTTSGSGTIVVATKPARPGRILRTIGFGCAYDLPSETFPLVADPQVCNGSLTEQRLKGDFAVKGWLAVSGVQVTFDAFDGTWLTGTMSGTLDPVPGSGAEAPLTIEASFKVKVTGAG
jgi:hypothetical protein